MVFGSLDQSLDASPSPPRRHQRHIAVGGGAVSRRPLLLRKRGLRRCAGFTRRLGHGTYDICARINALGGDPREPYYAESRRFATLFGIPEDRLSPDWAASSAYIAAMTESSTLTVTAAARAMAHR
jgi:hypothetical protein